MQWPDGTQCACARWKEQCSPDALRSEPNTHSSERMIMRSHRVEPKTTARGARRESLCRTRARCVRRARQRAQASCCVVRAWCAVNPSRQRSTARGRTSWRRSRPPREPAGSSLAEPGSAEAEPRLSLARALWSLARAYAEPCWSLCGARLQPRGACAERAGREARRRLTARLEPGSAEALPRLAQNPSRLDQRPSPGCPERL